MATQKKYTVEVVNICTKVVEKAAVVTATSKREVVEPLYAALAGAVMDIEDGVVSPEVAAMLRENPKKYRIRCELVRQVTAAGISADGSKPSKSARRRARRKATKQAAQLPAGPTIGGVPVDTSVRLSRVA